MGSNPNKQSLIPNKECIIKKFCKSLTVFMDSIISLWKQLKDDSVPPLFYLAEASKCIHNQSKNQKLKTSMEKILTPFIQDFEIPKMISKIMLKNSIENVNKKISKVLQELSKVSKLFILEEYKLKNFLKILAEWVRIMIFTIENKQIPEKCIHVLKSLELIAGEFVNQDVHLFLDEKFFPLVLILIQNSTLQEKTIILSQKNAIAIVESIFLLLQNLEKKLHQQKKTFKVKSLLKHPQKINNSIYEFIPLKWRKVICDSIEQPKIVIGREKKSKRANSSKIYKANTVYLKEELDNFANSKLSFYNFLVLKKKKHLVFVDVQNICRVSFLLKTNSLIEEFTNQLNVRDIVVDTLFESLKYNYLKENNTFWIMVNKGNVKKDLKTGKVQILNIESGKNDNILHVKVACYDIKTGTDLFYSLGGDEMDDIFIVNGILDLYFRYKNDDKFPFSSITVLSHDTFSNFKEYQNLECPILHHPKNLVKKIGEIKN